MKTPRLALVILLACVASSSALAQLKKLREEIPNPQIDYPGFLQDAAKVGELRAQRRLTEGEFIRMAADPGTIVLDARSLEKFNLLHIAGARHLSLPDVTAAELAKVIPSKDTRVLIYCNNNFVEEERAFPSKSITTSLNIYTFNTLYGYGYTNVYELGPVLNPATSKLSFEGTLRDSTPPKVAPSAAE